MSKPGGTSRYAEVATRLREEIRNGQLPPDIALPSEDRLATRHGVSRVTIRAALSVLRAEGLITTVKGGSTYVRDRRAVQLAVSRYSRTFNPGLPAPFQAAAAASGLVGSVTVISVRREGADVDTARKLAVAVGDEVVIRVRHMRLGDIEPETVQESTSVIPTSLVEGSPLAGSERILSGVYAAFAELGIVPTTMTEAVSSRTPTPVEAETLGLAPGMPVLTAERVTWDQTGRPIELVRVVATADRTVFVYDELPIVSSP